MSSPRFLKGVHFDQFLIFCVISYRPLVFFYCVLVILEVSVHRHTTSNYRIVLLKLFIHLYDIINSMWMLFELQKLFLMHHISLDIDYRQCLKCLQLIWLPAIVHLKLVKTTWRPLIEMYSTISTQCLTNQQRMVNLNTQFIVLITPYTVNEIVINLQTYSEITIKYNSRQTNIVSYIHCTIT